MTKNQLPVYTVSRLNAMIRNVLEEKLPSRLVVGGEISDWKQHSSGHCYFLLKDNESILPCVMWASKFRNVKFTLQNGIAVLCTGYIDVYTPGGKYQFYAESVKPAGVGSLQLAFEQMLKRLRSEGLFDEKHKKPLPRYPVRIGIVTSLTGAAVVDITESILNRWPCTELAVFPVPVQGEGAAEKIAAAVNNANRRNDKLNLDILIVGRGGGSLEDLWAFNEEVVARAIFNSRIPVISAVGHEVDITIADLVADARASTPSRAGVIAVPDKTEVLQQIGNLYNRLNLSLTGKIRFQSQALETIRASVVFRNPLSIISQALQIIDETQSRLTNTLGIFIQSRQQQLNLTAETMRSVEPGRMLLVRQNRLAETAHNLKVALSEILTKKKLQLSAAANRLEPMDPRSVLSRGYSITTDAATGRIVKSAKDVRQGQQISTELSSHDVIQSIVKSKSKGLIQDGQKDG